ncbi:MAG: hypothetical protein MJ113_06035 [Lachnospiraceae bacterium]|nr:hypothetical protein [Lachnospiraceae bacterium]
MAVKKLVKFSIVMMLSALMFVYSGTASASAIDECDSNLDEYGSYKLVEASDQSHFKKGCVYEIDDYYYFFLTSHDYWFEQYDGRYVVVLYDDFRFSYNPTFTNWDVTRNEIFMLEIPSFIKGTGTAKRVNNSMHYEIKLAKNDNTRYIYENVCRKLYGDDYTFTDTEEYDNLYSGITIDGKFTDWNSVDKYNIYDSHNKLDKIAVVWDEDYLYMYIQEKKTPGWDFLINSCNYITIRNSNNSYYNLVANITNPLSTPFVTGFDNFYGETCLGDYNHGVLCWEVAIPLAELGGESVKYFDIWADGKCILTEVKDLSNHYPVISEDVLPSSGITIDGYFDDWAGVNKTEIFYYNMVKHEAALVLQDGKLYGYYKMNDNFMSEFNKRISLIINESIDVEIDVISSNYDYSFNYGRNTNCHLYSYTFWPSMDLGTAATEVNFSHYPGDRVEFCIDLDDLAKFCGLTGENGELAIRSIEMQLMSMGSQGVKVAGVSTGPLIGVAITTLLSCSGFYFSKKKNGKKKSL